MSGADPADPAPIWHEVFAIVARGRGSVTSFSRCPHRVTRHSQGSVWIDSRCGGGGAESELNRAILSSDRGAHGIVERVVLGGGLVPDVATFFEGFTAGWRSPSTRSEAGERARAARERPEPPEPPPMAPVEYGPGAWHEAHPGRPDAQVIRICHHPVVRITKRYIYVQRTCPPWARTSSPYTPLRLSREELAAGKGVRAVWIGDKEPSGYAFHTRAWFFEGPVPAQPYRPPEWLAFRDESRRRWERSARAARTSAWAHGWGAWADYVAGAGATPAQQQPASTSGWEEFERLFKAAFEEAARRSARDTLKGARSVAACWAADLELLGLTSAPSADELKAAWRAAAKRAHPDAGGSAEAFVAVRGAYERLLATVVSPAGGAP